MPIAKRRWIMAADDFPQPPKPKKADKVEKSESTKPKETPIDDEGASLAEFIAESTVAEVRALVANGTLTAEEVYNAELAGKQRATLLNQYGGNQ